MNKIIEALRGGMRSNLIVGQLTTEILPAKSTQLFIVPIGVNRLLLKSIEVSCHKQADFKVEVYEEQGLKNPRYASGLSEYEVYDVLDLPYIDQENTGSMYFRIENVSEYDASYNIEVRGLELK